MSHECMLQRNAGRRCRDGRVGGVVTLAHLVPHVTRRKLVNSQEHGYVWTEETIKTNYLFCFVGRLELLRLI